MTVTTTVRTERQSVAQVWFTALTMLTGAVAGAGFAVGGEVFTAGPEFNVVLGIAAAACAVIAWLPVIALFDYLRRERDLS